MRTVDLDEACTIIDGGGILGYPTETVYGIGASIGIDEALAKVYELKGKPRSEPLSIACSSMEMASNIVDLAGIDLLRSHLPGPFTFILPALDNDIMGPTIGLRIPDCYIALELIDRTGPITSTSANLHGIEPPVIVEEIELDLPVLPGRPSRYGTASALVDMTSEEPRVLREGPIELKRE